MTNINWDGAGRLAALGGAVLGAVYAFKNGVAQKALEYVSDAPFAATGALIGLYGGATCNGKTIMKGGLVSLIHPFGKAVFEGNSYSNDQLSHDTLVGLATTGIAALVGYGASHVKHAYFTPKGVHARADTSAKLRFEEQRADRLRKNTKDLTTVLNSLKVGDNDDIKNIIK